MSDRGARQRRFRERVKEKQHESQRQSRELSERVSLLELEREQLRGALGTTNAIVPGRQSCSSSPELPDAQETALILCFGEATTQLQLTRGDCRALKSAALAQIWKRLVQRIAWSLDSVAAFPREHCHKQQTEDLVHEATSLMWMLVDHNPGMLNKLVTTVDIDDPTKPHSSGSDRRDWPAILVAVQVEEGQAERMLIIRRTMLSELGALVAHREQLLAQLQGIQDVEECSEGATVHFTKAAGVMEQLHANVHALHVCCCFYLCYIYSRVLTRMQLARYLVACAPMGPDALSLVTCLATQRNEPSTDDVLMAEAAACAKGAEAAIAAAPPAAGPGRPACAAGDWRRAIAVPLCTLHAWPDRPPKAVAPSAEARRMTGSTISAIPPGITVGATA